MHLWSRLTSKLISFAKWQGKGDNLFSLTGDINGDVMGLDLEDLIKAQQTSIGKCVCKEQKPPSSATTPVLSAGSCSRLILLDLPVLWVVIEVIKVLHHHRCDCTRTGGYLPRTNLCSIYSVRIQCERVCAPHAPCANAGLSRRMKPLWRQKDS